MVIKCPTCGHQGKVDPSRIPEQGAKVKCPKCQNSFAVRKPGARQPAATPPSTTSPPLPQADPGRSAQPEPPPPPVPAQPAGQDQHNPPPDPEPALGFAGGGPAPSPAAGGGLSLQGPSPEAAAARDVACTGCLKLFKEEEVTVVGDRALCQSCQESFQAKGQAPSPPGEKPVYGTPSKRPRMEYGGFWIRVGAYLVDGVLLGLVFYFVLSPIFMKVATSMFSNQALYQDPGSVDPAQMQAFMMEMSAKMMKMVWLSNLISMVLMGGYFVVLEGGPGQTLGKKALGLRVVTPEGDSIGYLKALARYIGKIISGVILGIGFLMAAFDSEKRTLHDRMVNSRVIKE